MLMMNPKRHKRMSAGAVVAVMAGVLTAILAERREQGTAAAAVVQDTLGTAPAPDGSGRFYVALAVGLLALGFALTAFIRSQNKRY